MMLIRSHNAQPSALSAGDRTYVQRGKISLYPYTAKELNRMVSSSKDNTLRLEALEEITRNDSKDAYDYRIKLRNHGEDEGSIDAAYV